MVKKTLFITGGCLVAAGVLLGRDATSYVKTSVGQIHDSVRDTISVPFEIERAYKMITDLQPEIRRNMHVIAREEVEVERLSKQLEKLNAKQVSEKEQMVRLSSDLQSTSGDCLTYCDKPYSISQVKTELANRLERYKTNESTVESLRKVYQARQRSLDAARLKLDGMLAAKRQLTVDVAHLQARQKMLEVSQTVSELNIDDSRLARTKNLLDRIHTRIEVAERLVSAEADYPDEISLDEPEESTEIATRIAQYFGNAQPEIETLAAAQILD